MEGFTPSVLMMIILAVIIGFAVGCFFMKQREKIKEAKKKLTQQQRLIFVLIKEDEKKVKDVAELLEISEQSVRNQLSAALAKLRVYMKEYFPIFVIMFYNT